MPDLQALLNEGLRGRYTPEREVGRGGMATVFLAHDIKHNRPVALKVLHPALSAALGGERFLREIRITALLQHPHILTLIDSGGIPVAGNPDLLYYVMPYVDSESLRERLTREKKLSVAGTVRILRDVLDALTHAHRVGIVHRDIKPENIMVSGRHALVMDFGVAKAAVASAAPDGAASGTLTTIGFAIGTPAYMAPEQATGQDTVDARADLYAVGVLAYEMLTGHTPFAGGTPQAVIAAQITKAPAPIASLRPDLPGPFAAAIMRCLEKDPAARWQTAEDLLAHIDGLATPERGVPTPRRRPSFAWAAIGAAVLVAAWILLVQVRHGRAKSWVREQIPQLLALSERGQWDSAYVLARRVEMLNPHDSMFRALRPRFARRVNLRTNPTGATVWQRAYAASDSAWTMLGSTPLDSLLLPLSGGGGLGLNASRLRIERAGFRTLDLIGIPFRDSVIALDRDGVLPAEMVRIGGGELDVFFPGFEHIKALALGDYLMDRFEVTNAEFQRFVDSGGYRRRELWEYPFVKDGHTISWNDAIALMTDRTGRRGPATWEAGSFPTGQEKYPVAGVSWYEAAAYAKFAGKSLPTVAHWNHAASVRNSAWIVPRSNFSGQGTVPVGTTRAISAYGTYDMAGNVREWCLNSAGAEHFILGGGWNDEPYQFNDAYTQRSLDRSPTNGIRLVTYLTRDANLTRSGGPLQRSSREFLKERPVSDAMFTAYRRMYDYDRTPLNAAVVESVDEGDWVRELIRMDAAYSGDSLLVYLYLPKRGTKPYPAVVFFPGSSAIRDHAPGNLQWRSIDFVIKSGRAVLYPVYKGTYQRSDSLNSDVQDLSNFYRDHVIMWAKDLRRSIDYLETRADVATGQLAYYGVSWGGAMGGLLPAVEPRIKVSALYVAGLVFEPTRPEVEPVNFLPRIRIPTLMINGRYDFFFPLETSQIPMLRLLGTPPDQKRHVVEEGSHFVPRTRLIQEILTWLDRYQAVK